MKDNFTFEIFCIEPEDIRNENSLLKALSYSNKLWDGIEPTEQKDKNGIFLIDNQNDIKLRIMPIDTTKVLTEYIETAFIIKCTSETYEKIEPFRIKLLKHLKGKLNFKLLRILRDDVSTHIANELYPKINKVENLLRRYLIKFFIQRVGMEWWEVTAEPKIEQKVKMRLKDRNDEFSNYVKYDIEYADFDDLGTLIYKQSSGFNDPEKALELFLSIDSIEALDKYKIELQGNYMKYFKENFRDKSFEKLWKDLFKIRNKVAHQGTFYNSELDSGNELSGKLIEIVEQAEKNIDELVLSVQEKEAIRQATIDAFAKEENNSTENDCDKTTLQEPKIIGTIDLSTFERKSTSKYKVINEDELLAELDRVNKGHNEYIGLRWFVTEYLAAKDYSIGLTYSLLNILADKDIVELYDIQSFGGHTVKAIKKK